MPDDDTATALKALLHQVAELTAIVQKQDDAIKSVRNHNVRLLDEVKDARRAAQEPTFIERMEQQERERKLASLNLVQNPDGTTRLKSGPGDAGNAHVLSREDARDPQKYREAKAAAAARGVPLRIESGEQDPTMRNNDRAQVVPSKVFTFDDRHEMVRWLRADMQTASGLVNRRLAAERDGFTVKTFNGPDDLPAHARDQFAQLEATANAKSNS